MNQGIFTVPPKTIIEIYQDLPESVRAELIEYIIYLFNPPTKIHQDVLQDVTTRLSEVVLQKSLGTLLTAPGDVFLDQTSHVVKPDIAIMLNGNRGKFVSNLHFHGAPDMIVEVLCKGNVRHDCVKKKSVYQRFGIKEYWIVDPETKMCTGHSLRLGQFVTTEERAGTICSELLDLEISF